MTKAVRILNKYEHKMILESPDADFSKFYNSELVSMLQTARELILEQNNKTDFLTKRENKLQTIEQMYKSGSVDLDKLRKIVMEEE